MKKLYTFLICIAILYSNINVAQNLVANGSFENFISPCPSSAPNGAIVQVLSWKPGNYIIGMGTPHADLYCGEANYGGCTPGPVPNVGSDGIAYLGFHTRIYSPPYNEDIYQVLSNPLTAGVMYYISFDLMNCQSGMFTNGPSDFCVYTNIDTIVPACPTDNPLVVNVGCVPYDSISNVQWKHHSFNFIAPPNANVIAFSGGTCNTSEIYYYLDNIVLTSEVHTSTDEIKPKENIELYPNPATDNMSISLQQPSEIDILNIAGQIIKSLHSNENNITIDVSGFAKGMYFVKMKTENEIFVKKFIKE